MVHHLQTDFVSSVASNPLDILPIENCALKIIFVLSALT